MNGIFGKAQIWGKGGIFKVELGVNGEFNGIQNFRMNVTLWLGSLLSDPGFIYKTSRRRISEQEKGDECKAIPLLSILEFLRKFIQNVERTAFPIALSSLEVFSPRK